MEVLGKKEITTKEEQQIREEYEARDGRLFRKLDGKILWVVPSKARWKIVKQNHDDIGHPALNKTVEKLKRNFWFPRMRRYVKNYIGACLECLYNKHPGGKKPGKLHNIDKIGIPFHTLHLDHLGPFVKSKRGNSYVLVIVDGFTKFTILRAVKRTSSSVTARALNEVINIFGAPQRVVTDRGTAFTGKEFETLCTDKHIIHVKNATATPRANGQVERINRHLTTCIASMSKDLNGSDWDENLGQVQWSMNNTVHQTIKDTP